MRLVIFRLPVLFFTLLFSVSFTTPDYTGKNLLLLLGTNSSTKEFKVLKNLWLLDKNYESTQTGIKFFINSTTGKVESILVAGENYYSGGNRFKKCSAALPYGISLNDNATALQKKLGDSQKLMGRNTLKFYKENTALEVSFTDLETGKISSIKFYKEAKPAKQIIPLNINAPAELRQQPASKAVFEQKRTQFEQHIPVVPPVTNNKK